MIKEKYDNPLEAIESVQKHIEKQGSMAGQWLLEAGCGSLSRIKLPDAIQLAGIDISQKQLDRNDSLSEKICGDLQTYPLAPDKYALAICWDVLEHLPQPKSAVQNLVKSLQPGGLLILALPNVRSLKGLVTRYSPYGFHVWYYRAILGIKDAGSNETAPFKTFLKEDIEPGSMMAMIEEMGCNIEKLIYRDAMVYRLKMSHKALWHVYNVTAQLLKLLTMGRYGGSGNSDYIVIARKNS